VSADRPLRAVLLDVDFTLAQPGPLLRADGYAKAAANHGLELDVARYDDARLGAWADVERHPELDHDEEIWVRFTEDVLRGMGGAGPRIRDVALEILRGWEEHANFELYDDVLPAIAELRAHGLRLGLVSNASRDLEAFSRHHGLDVDAWISSGSHGKVKPSPTIFRAVLELLDAAPEESAMVGDQPSDDVDGARAIGMRAFLLDREGRYPGRDDTLGSLAELPGALGLTGTGSRRAS
jgi:putative hydrolase of the HAD superfamily